MGLGAYRRTCVGARRVEDRFARRAKAYGHARRRGRALPHDVRHRSLVKRVNPLPVRCYRWTRTCVHVVAGVATTMFVFPLVSDAKKRRLVKRWSARLLRILKVRARIDGELAGAAGNVLIVANHISWLDI